MKKGNDIKEIELKIIKDYKNGIRTSVLAKKYGYKTKKSITDKLKKYNIHIRNKEEQLELECKKKYRSFKIEVINNKFKAYLLGIIASDGYIYEKRGTISISMTDYDVIKYLSDYLEKDYVIVNKEGNRKVQYRITFNNKDLVLDLKNRGLFQNKSRTIKEVIFYEDEICWLPYFIRGQIDGDGWIRKDGKEFFICTASQEYAKFLLNCCYKIGMKNLKIIKQKQKFKDSRKIQMFYIRSALKYNINILKEKCYKDDIGMKIKYYKINNIKL